MKKYKIFFYFFIFLSTSYALESNINSKWVIGAQQFYFSNKRELTQDYNSIEKTLPALVLEQLAEKIERTPTLDELQDRKAYDFRQKRVDLFLQLSNAFQTRDALVLGNYSKNKLEAKIKEADKNIESIKAKLAENLDEEKKQITDIDKNYEKNKLLEQVSIYNNSYTSLFSPSDNAKKSGYTSSLFEKEVISAKINSLITGEITIYSNYISVTATLVIYPGAKVIGVATDVGSIDDIRSIATRVANLLTPSISNSLPIELIFAVEPKEASENITITIDDVVYKKVPDKLVMQSGVHSILFSSPGFEQIGISYAFRDSKTFSIVAEMKKKNESTLSLKLKKPLIGTIYANGENVGDVDENNRFVKLTINDKSVLGQFISEDGTSAPFYIASKLLQDDLSLVVNAKPFDRSKYIDTRRRWMYASYSVLITSLLATFFTYGTLGSQISGYYSGGVTYNNVMAWQTASKVCIGISIGAGVWLAYELVRYFIAADKVLPKAATISNEKYTPQNIEEKVIDSDDKKE